MGTSRAWRARAHALIISAAAPPEARKDIDS